MSFSGLSVISSAICSKAEVKCRGLEDEGVGVTLTLMGKQSLINSTPLARMWEENMPTSR